MKMCPVMEALEGGLRQPPYPRFFLFALPWLKASEVCSLDTVTYTPLSFLFPPLKTGSHYTAQLALNLQ